MNSEFLTSRFFSTSDKRMDKVIFPLPAHWWSRFYEYAWAAEFCKETDVVLDAACGIAHPFKFYLADHCKAVHAIDIDSRINDYMKMADEIQVVFGEDARNEFLEKELYANPEFKQASITELPYKNNMFDKVFCISVLEHLPDADKQKALKEFRRVLKSSGIIILTLDYPDTTMDQIEAMANEARLKLAGDKNVIIPQDAIHWNNHLYCFRMVLVKKKDGE
jgi:ubiquinone/menaquinone biosynthesis C-methylase UbiE